MFNVSTCEETIYTNDFNGEILNGVMQTNIIKGIQKDHFTTNQQDKTEIKQLDEKNEKLKKYIQLYQQANKLFLQYRHKSKEVAEKYKEERAEAFDVIYNHYHPILCRTATRNNNEDLSQELLVILIKAIETFKPECNVKFNTYFWRCAKNHLGAINIKKNAKRRVSEHLIMSMNQKVSVGKNKDVEPIDIIEDKKNDYDNLIFHLTLNEKIMPYLKDCEAKAVQLLLEGYTLDEIGQELGGLTAPAVHIKLRRLADKKRIGKEFKTLHQKFNTMRS